MKTLKILGTLLLSLVIIAVGLLWCLLPPALDVPAQRALILTDVSVFNAGTAIEPHQTLMVKNGLISAIRATEVGDPEPICPGCIVMPGLIDAHLHMPPQIAIGNQALFSLLYLSHGVTSVRDTGASDDSILDLRARLNSGQLVGPRMFACGPVLDGDPPIWPMGIVIKNAGQARLQVQELAGERVDCIKLYNAISLPVYGAIAEAASEYGGIPVIGHVPHAVGIRQLRNFEVQHVTGIPYAHGRPTPANGSDWDDVDLNALTAEELDDVVAIAKTNGLSFTPTLINAHRRLIASDPQRWPATRVSNELPEFWKVFWAIGVGHPDGKAEIDDRLEAIEKARIDVRALHAGGVDILAGTDTLMPYVAPGEALLDEIQELAVALGSNDAALAAATRVAGQHIAAGEVGVVAVGARADLLLLHGDPRADLDQLKHFEYVIVDGRLYSRTQLESWRVLYQGHFHGWLYQTLMTELANLLAADYSTTHAKPH